MSFTIIDMDRTNACKILTWHYEDPYSIYDLTNDESSIEELLNGTYFALLENNELIGYYCFGKSARVPLGEDSLIYDLDYLDIGVGLIPDKCDKGFGFKFMNLGLNFFQKRFNTNRFRLTVLDFNERAIRLYQSLSFVISNYFKFNKCHYFLVMTREDFR